MRKTEDPTQIELRSDPTSQRMRGYTRHGGFHFDCEIVTEVADNLWTGGWDDGMVLPENIEHLVSLYKWGQYIYEQDLKSKLIVEMYDTAEGTPDREQILTLAKWVNVCRKSGPTLVHCQAGLNRSGMVSALALMLDGMTSHEAIDLLREKRDRAVLCNPSFEKWLHGFEED